ncbi:hypothetical protein H0H92_014154 [Tricholoma furcatifolium]|nr:hypothetical protein H0H92_014154 [Tricholoma furcatifolium]
MIPWEVKGKARQVEQSEGDGGEDGIVLPLQVVQTDTYDVAYTIQITVGQNNQNLYLQVDTGSSDLWIASKSCSSSACGQASGHLYDPSSSTSTGQTFNIEYLQGNVSGPVVWDSVVVGGYSIENQALAAATTITSEPLGAYFSGILGLALPLNSIIAQLIPPTTSNSPDGAAWASNLFSITPASSAPSARFISLLLSRPGSDDVPAQIGIGRHPQYVPDPSKVQYAELESEEEGTLYWKVQVRAITAWVGGVEKPIDIGRSNNGEVYPSAVLDSGVPVILTTSQVANGIYGAIGIGPASDGNYYVPCTTPLNITITLDNRDPISIHPLDLTSEPSDTTTASSCIGLIQADDSLLAQADSGVGDMILGVPFLRNAYTVMAYEPPEADGSFPAPTSINASNSSSNSGSAAGDITPRLGLLGITNATQALDEFNTVRVLNKPISSSGSSGGSSSSSGSSGATVGKHLSVGIVVLVSLLGFFAACVALFGIRWFLTRRRYRRGPGSEEGVVVAGGGATAAAALAGIGRATIEKDGDGGYKYALASTRGSRDLGKGGVGKPDIIELELELGKRPAKPGKQLYADEDTMRSGYEAYMQDHGLLDLGLGSPKKSEVDVVDDHDHNAGWGDDTLVGGRGVVRPQRGHERSLSTGVPLLHEIDMERTPSGSGSSSAQSQTRHVVDEFGAQHSSSLSISNDDDDLAGQRTSMAGVGTAGRSGRLSGGSTMPISVSMGMAASGWSDRERTISVGDGGETTLTRMESPTMR